MRHVITLTLIIAVLLTSVSNAYSQDSKRSTLIIKCEQAVDEVVKARAYIDELEASYATKQNEVAALEKSNEVTAAQLAAKKTEADELRVSIDALKTANLERVKEIAKMQEKLNKAESKVRFWRKVALISTGVLAAGVAGMVLTR